MRMQSSLTLKLDKIRNLEGICSIHHQWGTFSIYAPQIYANSSSVLYIDSTGTAIWVKETTTSAPSRSDLFSVSSYNVNSIDLSASDFSSRFQIKLEGLKAQIASTFSEVNLDRIFPLAIVE
jgi:hypothetical protein